MTNHIKLLVAMLGITAMVIGGCKQSPPQFSALALEGKQVFERHECAKCHSTSEARSDSAAPDLTNPFLANDSQFVQVHLKFVERTAMPPIQLTEKEIRLLSYYVAELHAARQPAIPASEADAICAVCYAPVSTARAREQKLSANFLGQDYYFECQACFDTFKKAPEAFIELMELHENEQQAQSAKQ